MKKLTYFFLAAMFLTACGGGVKTAEEAGEVSQTSENAVVYTVDNQLSSLRWEGAKITETVHYGTVNITEGSLSFDGGNLEAGNFVIDMTSILVQDLTEDTGKLKLEGHLKSGDFFLVEEFPTASFEITSVAALDAEAGATHSVSGNLTIKGITNGITFPATISVDDATATASATFEINRNEWGVLWGGSKTEQSIKDFLQNNLIKDMITFRVNLTAVK